MAGPAFIDNSIDKSGPSQPLSEPIDNSIDNSGSQGLGNTTGPLQGHYRANMLYLQALDRLYSTKSINNSGSRALVVLQG